MKLKYNIVIISKLLFLMQETLTNIIKKINKVLQKEDMGPFMMIIYLLGLSN